MTPSEYVTGTATTIAAFVFVLNKLGVWTFSTKNGNGHGKPCPVHEKVMGMVDELKEIQSANCEKHKQHEKELEQGQGKFSNIETMLQAHGEGIAILLDRTGGRPEGFLKRAR